ncbi:MAG: MoaD/ThiS family protein [Anaerolineales bacterium]|jgi:molybdopterin converting factor small subunit
MITVQVLFFATIRSIIGLKKMEIELPEGSTVRDLKTRIAELYPQADQAIESMLTSVNRIFSDEDTCLFDQAEIAFFPHISGG